jgi:U3 small nucleolar RNA-associated protein 25
MLYTGRANYFHRYAIKGVQHLIFLGVPEHPEFYSDYVNSIGNIGRKANDALVDEEMMMSASSPISCSVLFTKYEAHALERVVGSGNCSRMLSSPKTTFMFQS